MQSQNISDIIEKYLKSILADSQQIEIKRSEIAELFNCVPSQINYVINTRFTIQNGYVVKSKRGGGGYIRIVKVNLLDDSDVIDDLINMVGDEIDFNKAFQIIQSLYQEGMLTRRESNLIISSIDKRTLAFENRQIEKIVRARILISILNRLRYDD
ncbi:MULTISPECIES: CtsR family transcriptional regulator [Lactobacillaceae]|uniref:Transcriptional regulator CtsR n=2 Tax=Liquorilactobacillus mali TaxID=1618 RepID=A0A0R2E0F3_9LACO|nr:CtsR family transcriptional regulator [Liquorilactobacillus mali]KRN09672.1 transcriptional regulator CtsR [Liquorilactobacillus mali KCTC 3596 = DSM 20444]KRN27811.1 transcriptional regulator CtsR [Liquorilactobacillus mali]MDC7952921.1 CtsR family transcriptional regulator [Liquorilactobacillus mali]MDN7146165.1 CtsR family transcriptional regulator [Liquorilactobacillus mali]MDV7758373.1 CtsR family transcriptional regulator [Liquorilactobacillus mali]